MKIRTLLCLFFLLCIIVRDVDAKVSLENVKLFFQLTYDRNKDQTITWKQFCDYFKLMEPDHNFQFHVLNSAFTSFDINNDGKIILDEFLDFSDLEINYKPGHKQIHIGLTQNQHEMQVMWVSNPQKYSEPVVAYGTYPTKLNRVQNATSHTYNVGHWGFHGQIYRAVMKNLNPGQRYYYKVGDIKTNTFSELKYFKAPPSRNQSVDQIRMAVFGDMGTYAPFGHMVSKMIASHNTAKPYDFVFLVGDIAYAGMGSQKTGQQEPIWDLYGEQTQSFAAYTAFMPGVGNHERFYNYTSYFSRYRLPRTNPNQTNLWFSFDYGQVHMVHLSSEHDYTKGSQQYNFLEEDLKQARKNPNTKWIIVGTHRAFYCSSQMEFAPITKLTQHLEDLINEYDVDLVINGHIHSYERMWPVFKGKAIKQRQSETYYVNPQTPVYVVQGQQAHQWVRNGQNRALNGP